MSVFDILMKARKTKGGGFLLLLDPDRSSPERILHLAERAGDCEVDAVLVGSSIMLANNFHRMVEKIKQVSTVPVVIFPGAHSQISPHADAILFSTLISGRNPQYLIDEQAKGAPLVKAFGIEPISTGYMLIESGRVTSVQYISGTLPIPSNKPDIACAHALAAQYMGMKLIFMEAGSGAANSVPEEMIEEVSNYINLPIMIGGGVRRPEEVRNKIEAGASFVVVGNHFESEDDIEYLREFTAAAHPQIQVGV